MATAPRISSHFLVSCIKSVIESAKFLPRDTFTDLLLFCAVCSDLHFVANHIDGLHSVILAHLELLVNSPFPPKLVLLLTRSTDPETWLPVAIDAAQRIITVGSIGNKTVRSDVIKGIANFYKIKVGCSFFVFWYSQVQILIVVLCSTKIGL